MNSSSEARPRPIEARQQVADRHAGRQPQRHEVRAVLRLQGGDPDVADQRQPKAAAHGVAVERADDRHRNVEQREKWLVHRVAPLMRRQVVAPALDAGGEVRAGREAAAGAGHDQHAEVALGARGGAGARKRVQQLGRHAVAVVRPIERDDADAIARLVTNGFGHLPSLAGSAHQPLQRMAEFGVRCPGEGC